MNPRNNSGISTAFRTRISIQFVAFGSPRDSKNITNITAQKYILSPAYYWQKFVHPELNVIHTHVFISRLRHTILLEACLDIDGYFIYSLQSLDINTDS
jgi:hypothetical protein